MHCSSFWLQYASDASALKMKERSSLCDSAADGNWGLKYKRKRSKLTVSPSNENEATSPTSDSPRGYGSTKKKLKHDPNISPSAKKIRGNDGVNFSLTTCSFLVYLSLPCIYCLIFVVGYCLILILLFVLCYHVSTSRRLNNDLIMWPL